MKRVRKNCGSCAYFLKWKNDKFGGGLCDFFDARTKSDCGHKCDQWKGIKYNKVTERRANKHVQRDQNDAE